MMDNDMTSRRVSRRDFVKLGTAAALATAFPLLGSTGCKSKEGDEFFYHTRTVTDDAGREVTIPTADTIERVYFTSPLAEIYVFTLNPDVLGGTGTQFTSAQLEYLPEGMEDLLYMGAISAGGTIDREMLMQQDIQIVFSISGVELSASNISDAEDLQEATGIPCVLIDGSFDKITDAYRFLGDILGQTEKAETIAAYLEDVYAKVTDAVSGVAEEDKVSFYYAEGPLGLQTEPEESQHAKAFEVAGGRNVAQCEVTYGGGMTNVSLESVISWDPEVIISWDAEVRGGAVDVIRESDSWANITAVKNGRVYAMPSLPFAWCDRPNGVQRWLGIQWLANMFYPDLYDVDMVEVAKDFYEKVYNIEVTDDQMLGMLDNSYPPYGR